MADKVVNFFNPTDVLGLGGTWVQQENNLTDSVQRAQGLGADGDEVANTTHGGMESGTVVYESHTETALVPALVLPLVGAVEGGYHIDSLSLVYQPTGWPRLTVTCHQHDSNAHEGTLNTFTPSLADACPAQFGIPRALGIEALDDECGVRALTYTVGCTHVDEDENGEHLAGQNRDGVETLAYEFTGDPGAMTGPEGWDELSDGAPKSNTAAETRSIQWEHHLTRDV